ncbi:MAG TPA: alpha/beta hydrolase [Acidimicrobiales bacterium]|nr:alpha/beta hydrolase [Acidimicrobiales bacterium]
MVVGRTGRAAALVVSLLMLAACSSSPHRSAPPPSSSTTGSSTPSSAAASTTSVAPSDVAVAWQKCSGGAGPSGYQCATIQVPRNPRDPSAGGTIGLALDRRPASGQKIGSLLINPGGPGASGVDFLPQMITILPKTVLQHFDVVGFDPPGVGRSAPIVCLDGPGLDRYFHQDPAPPTAAGVADAIAEDRVFAQGCQQRSGAELPYVSTVDAAMDMDVMRRDLGDAKLTYLGFSYGTFLGATYAGLFPNRIRAMVLDGAMDPSIPVLQSLDQQSAAFDDDLKSAVSSCASSPTCPWKPGPNGVQAFQRLVQQVRVNPLPVDGSSRVVGPAELLYGVAATLYSTTTWGDLDQALAQAESGNGTDVMELFDEYTGRSRNGQYTNEFEANAAVNCLDAPAPSIGAIQAHAPVSQSVAPVFGLADLYSEFGCAVWPVPATGAPAPIHAAGSPPIVVVGTTGDPATPYQEAQSLASQLDHGVLLTRLGEGHTGYGFSSCVRNYVDAYLINLQVPAAGIRCPSD